MGSSFLLTWRATHVRCHENADAAQRGARTSPVLSLTHVTRHSPSVSYLNLRVSRLSADPFARLGPVRDPHVRTRAIRRRRKRERYGHLRKPKLHKCPFTRPDARAQRIRYESRSEHSLHPRIGVSKSTRKKTHFLHGGQGTWTGGDSLAAGMRLLSDSGDSCEVTKLVRRRVNLDEGIAVLSLRQ
ncbi:hypothetical protein B296_00048904 [Ensete ventricosum]|uniref:Uncharacterized protein n=1 Tax=Ensete ventricosum TaxID=4639 RepID=A0A426YT12_ENSVE|nr:hypothetical protein B296_00048904 [Ensete ventricosum]